MLIFNIFILIKVALERHLVSRASEGWCVECDRMSNRCLDISGFHPVTGRPITGGLLQLNFIPNSSPAHPPNQSNSNNSKKKTNSNRGSTLLSNSTVKNTGDNINLEKSNILLLGPTGSGERRLIIELFWN